MNKNRYLLKNTALYGISTFVTKLITFVMVPFYTYVLTKEQYGTVDIIFTTVNLLLPVLTLSIHLAVLRFALEKDSDKKLIFTYGILVVFVDILLLFFMAPFFSKIELLSGYGALLTMLFGLTVIHALVSEFIRGLEKIKEFVIGNIIFVCISTILNIYTILILHLGVHGYILSYCFAYLMTVVYYTVVGKLIHYFTNTVFQKSNIYILWDMLKYSVFLIPNALFWWVTNASDRYIILGMLGAGQNGIYAVANKVPMIATAVCSIFIQAWTLTAIKESTSADRADYHKIVFQHIYSVVFIIASGLLVILKLFISIYVAQDYFISWESSTFLIMAAAFNTLAAFIGTNYVVAKRNLGNMMSTFMGAIINVALNFLLIPRMGLLGAALATYISYFVVVVYRIFDTAKYIGIDSAYAFSLKNILTWGIVNGQIILLFISDKMFDVFNLAAFLVILFLNRFLLQEGKLMVQRLKGCFQRKLIA